MYPHSTTPQRRLSRVLTPLALILTGAAPVLAGGGGTSGVTELVSLDETGQQPAGHSHTPSVSEDGRYVAFGSAAPLVAEDTNGDFDVYVVDRWTGSVACASVTAGGVFGDGDSSRPHLSADGRWVVFETEATNLQALDFNGGLEDVYRKDMQTGALVRVSDAYLSPFASNGESHAPSVSDDGRYVAFHSSADDLIAVDTNGVPDVFVRDLATGAMERVSEGVWGEANGTSTLARISGDGARVAYQSTATNLVLFDHNGVTDVFVKQTGLNPWLVSRNLAGQPGNGSSNSVSLSADGSYLAFLSLADDLVAGDNNGTSDIFVVEVDTLAMERASLTSAQAEIAGDCVEPVISRDGRTVAFESYAHFAPFASIDQDVYVRDLDAGKTFTGSRPSGTVVQSNGYSSGAGLALGGTLLVFSSSATNLVPGDLNGVEDVFVRTMFRDPYTYCAGASTTAQGCVPDLTTSGFPSVGSGQFFTLIGDDLPNQRNGLLFYGFAGASSNPWAGSTMCVAGAKKRTPLLNTGGNPPASDDCSGFFAFDMNGFAAGLSGGNPKPELSVVGQQVNVQFWGRQGPSGTYLSSAVEYVVGP